MMSDDQIQKLPIGCLQEDGLIFLWVTHRAHRKGLECFKEWG
jgi:mRNA (2'-O-methyladenosine-N6-)-methyltransferase